MKTFPLAIAGLYRSGTDAANLIPNWLIALAARVAMAKVFWDSGQSKVSTWPWEMNRTTIFQFREEPFSNVPLLGPETAASVTAWAEFILPILLVAGFLTRISAAGLLAMTAVIQIFVFPGAWGVHLIWATLLVFIIARGPGLLSLDRVIGFEKNRD